MTKIEVPLVRVTVMSVEIVLRVLLTTLPSPLQLAVSLEPVRVPELPLAVAPGPVEELPVAVSLEPVRVAELPLAVSLEPVGVTELSLAVALEPVEMPELPLPESELEEATLPSLTELDEESPVSAELPLAVALEPVIVSELPLAVVLGPVEVPELPLPESELEEATLPSLTELDEESPVTAELLGVVSLPLVGAGLEVAPGLAELGLSDSVVEAEPVVIVLAVETEEAAVDEVVRMPFLRSKHKQALETPMGE